MIRIPQMITRFSKGASRMSKGLVTAGEKTSHYRSAMVYVKVAARSEHDALSQEASRRSRDAKLFLAVSKLWKVVLPE